MILVEHYSVQYYFKHWEDCMDNLISHEIDISMIVSKLVEN